MEFSSTDYDYVEGTTFATFMNHDKELAIGQPKLEKKKKKTQSNTQTPTYRLMVAMALIKMASGPKRIEDIYSQIEDLFPHIPKMPKSWRNSVRHAVDTAKTTFSKNQTSKTRYLWGINNVKLPSLKMEIKKWLAENDQSLILKNKFKGILS